MTAPSPTIITGSNGAADVVINSLDYQCVLSNWRASASKRYTEQVTFCSGGWVVETAGFKQVTGTATGFLSKGNALSDPMLDFAAATGVAMTLTADTGCSLAFTAHIDKDMGVTAAGNSEFGIRFRSIGAVSSTWTVA